MAADALEATAVATVEEDTEGRAGKNGDKGRKRPSLAVSGQGSPRCQEGEGAGCRRGNTFVYNCGCEIWDHYL